MLYYLGIILSFLPPSHPFFWCIHMFSSLSVIFSLRCFFISLPSYLAPCPSHLQKIAHHCASKWTLGTHTHKVCMSAPYIYSTMQLYVHFCLHMYVPAVLKIHTHRERNNAYSTSCCCCCCLVLVLFLHTYIHVQTTNLCQLPTWIVEYSLWELVLALPPLPVLHWCCECQCLGLPLPLDELRNELVGEKDVGRWTEDA